MCENFYDTLYFMLRTLNRVDMEYKVVHTDAVSLRTLSNVYRDYIERDEDKDPPEVAVRDVDDALGTEQMQVKLWHFQPGDEIEYHAHLEQEELYYILEGQFSLKLGRSGETKIVEAGPGTFFVAAPKVGHGHRYVGEKEGVVLAIGAPPVDDPGRDPHSF